MTNETLSLIGLFACVFFVGALIGEIHGAHDIERIYRKEAIERGFAAYNSTNGIWQWNIRN